MKTSSSYLACLLKTPGFLLVLIFFLTKSESKAQLLDSLSLDTVKAFTSMEDALKEPGNVIKLVLKKKKYSEVPKEIFTFTNLQYLNLSKNNISEIPKEIGDLKNLQYLSVSKNKISGLPYRIGELSNLYYLDGSRNEILELPPTIGNLGKLKHMDLWDNEIDSFPEEIKNCKQLKTVDLRGIMISDAKQQAIRSQLRHTKIFFSPYCQCEQ